MAGYFGNLCPCQWKVQEHFSAFPCLVSPAVILVSSTRGTVAFSLVTCFPPFHLQLSIRLSFYLRLLWCRICGKSPKSIVEPVSWEEP